MKKFTIEFVRSVFEEEGYELLSNEYTNHTKPLKFKCPNGHIHQISFGCFYRKGQRCKRCVDDSLRLSIKYIREYLGKEGYKLISNKYINTKQKLEAVCPNGHITHCTFDNFRSGFRCKYCAKNVRHTIEFVRSEFEKEGYKLLSEYYVNQKQKLKYICPFGHTHEITWTDWHNGGYRCPSCYAIKISGEGNYNWKGGVSKEPYSKTWNNRLKKDIKERDSYRCLNPYCYSNNTKDLVVHHINYDKKDCTKQNLITICRACNIRAEVNRNWHKAWYQAIMHRRYNYIY